MELIVAGQDPIAFFRQKIEQESRIDVWNENRHILFDVARQSDDIRVKRAHAIWLANLKESIDDPKYGDDLFDAIFCDQHRMHDKTPNFYYRRMWVECDESGGRIVYENCILRRDMCGRKKWDKVSKLIFDGRTHEFRVKNEELGYPITVI